MNAPDGRDGFIILLLATAFSGYAGLTFLFGARRTRDKTLSHIKADNLESQLDRKFLLSPGYIISFRIGGAVLLCIFVLMLGLLIGRIIDHGFWTKGH